MDASLLEYKQKARDKLFQCVIELRMHKKKVENCLINRKYTPPQIQESLLRGDYTNEITTKRKKLQFFSDIINLLQHQRVSAKI